MQNESQLSRDQDYQSKEERVYNDGLDDFIMPMQEITELNNIIQ